MIYVADSAARRRKSVWIPMLLLTLCLPTWAQSLSRDADNGRLGPYTRTDDWRNYDARIAYNRDFEATPGLAQQQAINTARNRLKGLLISLEAQTGATRSLYKVGDYLTEAQAKSDRLDLALGFVATNATLLGLTDDDVLDAVLADRVTSQGTGADHIYLRQTWADLEVYHGLLQVNVNRDGRIISVNNGFLPDLARAVNTNVPTLDAAEAVMAAADLMGLKLPGLPRVISTSDQPDHRSIVALSDAVSVQARLMVLPVRRGDARLVWHFELGTDDDRHHWEINVDAASGELWTHFDLVVNEQYTAYAEPVESPIHTAPAPPADARTLEVDPYARTGSVGSPLGWHDTGSTSYTITRGNNVHAYEDTNNNDSGVSPDCGPTLDCTFALDLTQAPSAYQSAAVANLFYWNNIIHDITYNYGFDEAGGNFQVNNFGNGGAGNDDVRAQAQDGGGTNNANFFTPSDGSRPRMQMYLWTTTTPNRDGDLDNGIITHEYGHGISNRLVGGPTNVSCLSNSQQPGEGLSDWWSLWFTAEPGDTGADRRGVGTYALGQAPDGAGIRTQPYSTDPAINTHTYESIQGKAIPHGVGEVWAQAAWEAYWALVDVHGFSANRYDAFGTAGNQRMMLYVIEGLKNTSCSPAFTDVRDGIIQAATDNHGGEDVCTLWEAFGAFGLGIDAVSGGSNSTNPTNGFDIPLECKCSPAPIADAGPNQTICLGDSAVIGTPAQPNNTYLWSPGGATTAQITVSPSSTTTYTVTATTSCGSASDTATVLVDDGSGGGLVEGFEGDTSAWTATGLWHKVTNTGCVSPSAAEGASAFYYGQDGTCTYDTGSSNSGSLTSPVFAVNATSSLSFSYWRVVESFSGTYDTTTVTVIDGASTTDVWTRSSANASTAAWLSSGAIDLSAWAGSTIQLRFTFNSVDSVSNGFTGWLVDDIVVNADSNCSTNTAPVVSITAPADGSTYPSGAVVSFSGTANDAEDGDISAALSWTSNIDGALGTGASLSAALSSGTHAITASVTDSGGAGGQDTITVIVNAPPNTAPTATITGPANGSTYTQGQTVAFTGTANDAEDGDLTASLSWSSNLDGGLGTGGSVTTAALSVGTHTITAAVTDSGGLGDSDSVTVIIQAPANTPPTVTITAPADGTSVADGTALTFSGTATDTEDGTISASIAWSSDLDGALGTGASVSATLSVGTHTVTAAVTDSGGLGDSDTVTVIVTPAGWTELSNDDFEAGWGTFNDGGTDVRRNSADATHAHQGTYCIRLRDNSGSASAMFTDPLDLSSYSELSISFWFKVVSFESGENFFVEVFDGTNWQIVADFVVNVDFNNNSFYHPEVLVDSSSVTFSSAARVRIRADASGNADYVYVDEVVISAR